MYYTIYKITNKINNKIYIGKHQTNNIDDNYFGSGKLLKRAIEKYGIENFSKEVLYVYGTEKEMNSKEKEIVTEEFISRNNTYNLCIGGQGGFSYINNNTKLRIEKNKKAGKTTNNRYRDKKSEWGKKGGSAARKKHGQFKNFVVAGKTAFLGKKHTEETKTRMSLSSKNQGLGENNSQFGTIWITNGIENTKIRKDKDIPKYWKKGRVLK